MGVKEQFCHTSIDDQHLSLNIQNTQELKTFYGCEGAFLSHVKGNLDMFLNINKKTHASITTLLKQRVHVSVRFAVFFGVTASC